MLDAKRSGTEPNDGQDLWMIMAVIQPFKLDAVTLALESLPGFGGMTVSDCRGFGHGKGIDEEHGVSAEIERSTSRRGIHASGQGAQAESRHSTGASSAVTDFTRKVRLEVAVFGHNRATAVIEAIARAAHTGRAGDGKVFAWPLSHAVRVRTFAIGTDAL